MVLVGADLRHLQEASASHLFLPTAVERKHYTLSLLKSNRYKKLSLHHRALSKILFKTDST